VSPDKTVSPQSSYERRPTLESASVDPGEMQKLHERAVMNGHEELRSVYGLWLSRDDTVADTGVKITDLTISPRPEKSSFELPHCLPQRLPPHKYVVMNGSVASLHCKNTQHKLEQPPRDRYKCPDWTAARSGIP
jgi:hypothetical protein